MPDAFTVLPDAAEFTRRLHTVDDEPHRVEKFRPRLVARAGTEMTGRGFAMALHLAVEDYAAGMPPIVADALRRELGSYVRTVVDDPAVQRDALHTLTELSGESTAR